MTMFNVCVFIIYFALPVSHGAESNITNLPEYSSMCQMIRHCKDSPDKLEKLERSCCQRCSCTSDCQLVGSCCPDMPHNKSIKPLYSCISTNEILNLGRLPTDLIEKDPSSARFRVIDQCPNESLAKQYPACQEPRNLQDYVFVSDIDNEKVFKNQQCAMCQGENQLVNWGLLATCKEVITRSFRSVEDRDQFILQNCTLDVEPPNKYIEEMARCYRDSDLVNSCEGIDSADVYAKAIEEACLQERPTQNRVFTWRKKQYSNAYCYVCNNLDKTLPDGVCFAVVSGTDPTRFTALLDMFADEPQEEKDDPSRCMHGHIWDTYSKVCRELVCPFGHIPLNGNCWGNVKGTDGFTVFVVFEVKFLVEELVNIKEILSVLSYTVARNLFGCDTCLPKMYHSQNSTSRLLSLPMFTNGPCQLPAIMDRVRLMISRNDSTLLTFLSNRKEYNIELTVAPKNTTINEEFVDVYERKKCMIPPIQVDLLFLQNCPKFIIPMTEMPDLKVDEYSSEELLNQSLVVIEEGETLSVCVEKYYQLRAAMMTSRAVGRAAEHNFAVIPLFLYMFLQFHS